MRDQGNDGLEVVGILIKIGLIVLCAVIFYTQFYRPIKEADMGKYKKSVSEAKVDLWADPDANSDRSGSEQDSSDQSESATDNEQSDDSGSGTDTDSSVDGNGQEDAGADEGQEEEPEILVYSNEGEPAYDEGSWFYYDQMEMKDKKVYEMYMDLVEHKDVLGYRRQVTIPGNDNSVPQIMVYIYGAFMNDHPEFFYLRDGNKQGRISSEYNWEGGDLVATFEIAEVYEEENLQIRLFEKATKDFFADIDTTKSLSEIELQIHDKLLELVTYDRKILDEEDKMSLSHSAYGALVENESGEENYAVCDGYSLAFGYLLQRAGLYSAVIDGYGLPDGLDGGGHAWNVVRYGREWYEVDCTWDDQDLEVNNPDLAAGAKADKEGYGYATHRYYNITTERMHNTPPETKGTVHLKDGRTWALGGETASKHLVGNDVPGDNSFDVWISQFYPTAEGTKYSYRYE